MLQKLFPRSIRKVFAPRPDFSKASELVLVLNMHQREANSGSPEFFVQEITEFRVLHPNNKKARPSTGYELVGHILRKQGDGEPLLKSRAHVICWQRAWHLLKGKYAGTVLVCEMPRKRGFATASVRNDCLTFDLDSLVKRELREGKPSCAS